MAYNIGIETSPVWTLPSRSWASKPHNTGPGSGSSSGGSVEHRRVQQQQYSSGLDDQGVPRDGFWNLTTRGGLMSPRRGAELEQWRTRG